MPALLERLREALSPRYEIERELGGGGMGVVFLARDRRLDRLVAIKVLRPEQATAIAADRFVREARLLARLSHPNIVPVHDADETGGLSYYVMDCVEGETLDTRLQRGLLSPEEAVKLGRDVLDALEAAHRLGVIHRDIKPSNIFLMGDRALLADFGVARSTTDDALTLPGAIIGTPGYMPPEQSARGEVSPRTDLYSVGMVLYEALTGRRWELPTEEAQADWSGVPRPLLPALKRALAWLPEQRWPDAPSFRRAWWRTRTRRYVRRAVSVAVLGVVVGVVITISVPPPPPPLGPRSQIRIEAFAAAGENDRPWLGDSVARYLARSLVGYPDFAVAGPGGDGEGAHRGVVLVLGGTVRQAGDTLCAVLHPRDGAGGFRVTACRPAWDWRALADALAAEALRRIWLSDVLADLPRSALPRTPEGLRAFLAAERLFAQARWGAARLAYVEAEAVDSTCWLCSWRLYIIDNWMGIPHDPQRADRYLSRVDSFPLHYQSLMRASTLPMAPRLDTLRGATQRHPRFFLAWWMLGEELFHRAPLLGRSRREALEALVLAAELRPDYAPSWEHLAWVRTAEGDSAGARRALEQWDRIIGAAPRDTFSLGLRALVEVGHAWRFSPPPTAAEVTTRVLETPAVAASPDLAVGPRLMPTFDAPRGAVWLGGQFAAMRARPHLARSGLLAQVFGYVALGQPDSARARADELRMRFPEAELGLFGTELEGSLLLLDSVPVAAWRTQVEQRLLRYTRAGAGSDELGRRAAWMLALLTRAGAPAPADTPLPDDAGGGRAMRAFLETERLGRRGQWSDALTGSAGLVNEPAAERADPFLRALLRFRRAEWFARAGEPEAARRELRWAEHYEVVGYPVGPPQAAEVDWSLRTLARWRLATALDAAGERDDEVCRAYARVARSWAAGAPIYRARADSARARARALSCEQAP